MNDLSKLTIEREVKRLAPGGRRRWRYVLTALAIVSVAYAYQRTGGFARTPEVELATVATAYPSQAVTLFNATGYVVPQTRADIASKATGRLEALEVDEGSVVKKNQVLARLESADVVAAMQRTAANVISAHASIAEARARYSEAQAKVNESQAELHDAERALARSRAMRDKKFVTEEIYDAALARRDRAAAIRASADASVIAVAASIEVAQAGLGAAEATLAEAQVAVDYTLIRAPFDGVILSKHADIGDVLAPFAAATEAKGAVVTMADLDTLQVEADISESNLIGLKVGQPCEIQLDALPDVRLRGEVHMIVPTIDRTKATVLAKVRFIDRDLRVLPDMSARVAFLSRAIAPAAQHPHTVVPATAVVTRGERRVVYRLHGETVEQVSVTLGEILGDMLEVTAGVTVGDKVVIAPPAGLHDGARVRTRDNPA